MKYLKAFLLFLVAFLIQTSLLNIFAVFGYTPNLILCLTIVLSYMYDDRFYGLIFGAVFGLLYDICFGTLIGPMAISLLIVILFIVFIREYTNIENIVNIEIVSIICIVMYYFIYFALSFIGGCKVSFNVMFKTMIGSGIYSMIVISLMYVFLLLRLKKKRRERYFNR